VKSKKARVALVIAVLLVPAYWWLLVESGTPSSTFALDLAELRQLANSMPGEKPSALHVEEVAEFEFPSNAVLAGSGWSTSKLPVFSYQLVYGDRTVVVDTAMDQATAKDASRFDPEAYARMSRAMEAASLIVITHEHLDHLGGFATHPKAAELKAKLTDEQLADPSKRKPLVIPDAVLRQRTPFTYARAVAVAPGVVLWRSPGHTPGSQLVFVQRQDGEEFLLLGDVAWHQENYEQVRERARLVTQFFLGEDRDAVLAQLSALRTLAAAEPKLHLVPGHDGPAMKRLLDAGLMSSRFQPPAPPAPCPSPAECSAMAWKLKDEVTTPENDAKIFTLVTYACAHDDAEGCLLEALMHKYGTATVKDSPRAYETYEKSCRLGSAAGCFNVGLMAKVGLGTPQSWTVAEQRYQQSCDGGYGMSCRELAHAHQTGEGLAKDEVAAAAYLRLACETHDLLAGETSCADLKVLCKTVKAPACR